jgi:ubiquinone/menaquinone biosynthesis C-methylase UbiE
MSNLSASLYDPVIAPFELMGLRRWRQWALRVAQGRVLEIGIGTGSNVQHYHGVESVTAIDPDSPSLEYARAKLNGSKANFRLAQARAEELPFPDESFDSVIATLVFCTIGDPARGMEQVYRVLKRGGAFRLVEHVRADHRFIAGVQDAMSPMWQLVADGCHLDRDTVSVLERAGFDVKRVHKRLAGIIVGIDAVK